ncbi:hypothetical protein ACSQ67_006760 [Phaseolus vulgaris]
MGPQQRSCNQGATATRCCTRGNKRSVIGEDGARNKASSKERVSNPCIEHGGWVLEEFGVRMLVMCNTLLLGMLELDVGMCLFHSIQI